MLALRLEDEIKARAKENQGSRNDLNIPQKSAKSTETRKELAKLAGVSHEKNTIHIAILSRFYCVTFMLLPVKNRRI